MLLASIRTIAAMPKDGLLSAAVSYAGSVEACVAQKGKVRAGEAVCVPVTRTASLRCNADTTVLDVTSYTARLRYRSELKV